MDLSIRNMLGPAAWTALALVPPAIFALYFLKLKRTPVEVPSTYLWHRVIEDLHVNSLWQRLRRSLLLFLQLLLAILAILAVLRPGWQGQELQGQKFIFLIDNSASMSAADVEGKSRLESAKKEVHGLIDQMESDMSAMVISFSDRPDVVQEFTNNHRLLHEAIDRIQPTARPTSIRGALELADGFANPGRVAIEEGGTEFEATEQETVELYVLSDGRFGPVDGFSLGNLEPRFLPFGSFDAQNLAITGLAVRRNENRPEQRQAFVQVANLSIEDQTAVVELTLDGALVDAAEIQVGAGEVRGATFNLGEETTGALRARVSPPDGFADALKLDDDAFAAIDEHRDARALLITPGNRTLETALATDRAARLAEVDVRPPEDLKKPEMLRLLQTETYDLVIFDQCEPDKMPAANTLFIGRLPPLESWRKESSTEPTFGPQIIDWDRGHPLLNLVELGNVLIVDSWIVDPPAGGRTLIDSTKGGIFAIAPRDAYEDAVLGFEIVGRDDQGNVTVNTDWYRSFGFPNFCLNILEYLAGGSVDRQMQTYRPGTPIELNLRQQASSATVTLPDGQQRDIEPADGKFVFHEAQQLGVYRVSIDGNLVRRFAVNLFDREESDLALRERQDDESDLREVESLSIGYADVAAEKTASATRKELWKWLLLAALAVLVIEWYIYNRRVYV